MDFLIEFFMELYMELMMLIVPEKGDKTKRVLSAITAFIVLAGTVALVIWGVTLIFEQNNLLGIIPLAIAIIISIVQIVFGIVFFNKNH